MSGYKGVVTTKSLKCFWSGCQLFRNCGGKLICFQIPTTFVISGDTAVSDVECLWVSDARQIKIHISSLANQPFLSHNLFQKILPDLPVPGLLVCQIILI
jgi:hypothetical protein